jgi:hypothetical protein
LLKHTFDYRCSQRLTVPDSGSSRVTPLHTIPFGLRAGHIVLTAEINGVTARMILDSGSGTSTLDAEWAKPLDLPPVGAPVTALGAATVSVPIATAKSIRLGTLELLDQRVVIVPLTGPSAQSGMPIHGTIGRPLSHSPLRSRVFRLQAPASSR